MGGPNKVNMFCNKNILGNCCEKYGPKHSETTLCFHLSLIGETNSLHPRDVNNYVGNWEALAQDRALSMQLSDDFLKVLLH